MKRQAEFVRGSPRCFRQDRTGKKNPKRRMSDGLWNSSVSAGVGFPLVWSQEGCLDMGFGDIFKNFIGGAAARLVERRWASRASDTGRPHGLKGELIVSLTSYPARFHALPLTIKCLLNQTMRADRVILWLAEQDIAQVSPEMRSLEKDGLEIRVCADQRQYNKIIPTLRLAPDAFVITADDDTYYWPQWVEGLVRAYDPKAFEILCHRADRIRLDSAGTPFPYSRWQIGMGARRDSDLVFPTGVGGVLYRPGILHEDVLNSDTFLTVCPTTDDIWLYFMAGRNGATYRKVGRRRALINWPGTQGRSLWAYNKPARGGNDQQFAAMTARYGFPPRPAGAVG